ncbi:diacylglycerol kinase family protein [Lysinibacillus sp. FSL K6-0232]|uniref:diacylglycerol/lipid kinase family protein n=1 Tax=unclassified Lysinibacillus TaxID=2636778 RepID=UPI0030F917CF
MQLLFIVNEAAGNGRAKKVWQQLQQQLTIAYEVAFTAYEGHGTKIAKHWAQQHHSKKLIIVIGGDGTIHEVVSGIVHNEFIVIGVVRAGSGNDFARYFPIFRNANQIEAYVKTAMASTKMDIGIIEPSDRQSDIFVNNTGVGFDAYVAKAINTSRIKFYLNKVGLGKLSYAVAVIRGLFHFNCFNVTVHSVEQTRHFQRVWFVAASNQPYFGGGMKIAPAAKADDGLVDLTIVHGISPIKLLFAFVTVFFGKHTKFKEITFLQEQYFNIVVEGHQVDCHTDGNYIGVMQQGTTIHCTVKQQAWQVIAQNGDNISQ